MSAENYSADGRVEDSVLEYNGARGLIFIGGAGFVFFLILTLLMVIFRFKKKINFVKIPVNISRYLSSL